MGASSSKTNHSEDIGVDLSASENQNYIPHQTPKIPRLFCTGSPLTSSGLVVISEAR